MRKLFSPISKSLLLVTLLFSLAAPAAAGTLWRWVGEDGTVSFTDDPKRIPARYRGAAEQRQVESLSGYERFTPADDSARASYADQMAARIERLRAFNEPRYQPAAAATAPAGSGVVHETVLRMGRRGMIRVPTPTTSQEPVILEQRRVRPAGSMVTRHVTVVRQGDRVLSIIRPQSTHQPLNWPDESELYE